MAATNIAQEISRLTTAKADLKTAIEGKGVTVPSSTLLDGYASLVDQIQQGGAEEAPENDVNFYDYDGFRVASYTITEAKALTALPTPPSHEGLTFQAWNWSLADIQGYNRQYIDIGANYAPNDGNTHLKIIAISTDISFQTMVMKGALVVDFGDGTTDTFAYTNGRTNHTFTHTYATTGAKEIIFSFTQSANDGMFGFSNISNTTIWFGFNTSELNLGHYTDTSVHCQLTFFNADFCLSVPTYLFNLVTSGYGFVRQITFPRDSGFSITAYAPYVYAFRLKMCFPPSLSTINSQTIFGGVGTPKIVMPETTTSTPYANNTLYNLHVAILSLPSTASWTSAVNFNSQFLEYIDIVQGWVPNFSMPLSNSTRWSAENMVKFFNKLGTTQTAITLTFGTTNLDKLTADQKAVATNKGYTLA